VSAIIDDHITVARKSHEISPSSYHDRKAILDRTLGGVLLVICAPALVLLIVLVRATSAGGGIYKQKRVGKDGKEYWLYKIRTMYANAEAIGGPQWAKPKDSRTTPLGRALRFLHLDELPQLVNVVQGDMSLIGPRPERPEFVRDLVQVIPNYLERLKVLPGITGLAQINLPADESLESVKKKVIVDCEYIESGSASLDFRILICTALRMLGIRHGRAPRWLGLEYQFPEPPQSLEETVVMSLDDTAVGVQGYAREEWGNGAGGDDDVESGAVPTYEHSSVGARTSAGAQLKRRATPRRPK
jgi:lipopolysaccharide/colanic/teichoic acid biosynthesis glycosyltransferase